METCTESVRLTYKVWFLITNSKGAIYHCFVFSFSIMKIQIRLLPACVSISPWSCPPLLADIARAGPRCEEFVRERNSGDPCFLYFPFRKLFQLRNGLAQPSGSALSSGFWERQCKTEERTSLRLFNHLAEVSARHSLSSSRQVLHNCN